MSYSPDLSQIDLNTFKKKLLQRYIVPSRAFLKEGIDWKFDAFLELEIANVYQLQGALKSKKKMDQVSESTNIPMDYLKVLLREINSNDRKPIKFSEFSFLSQPDLLKLEKVGILNTKQFYDNSLTEKDRERLSKISDIPFDEITKIAKLCNLCRIRWVNHTFSWMLYSAGFDTVEKICDADYVKLHQAMNDINSKQNFYKGQLGINDMKLLVEVAEDVFPVVKF